MRRRPCASTLDAMRNRAFILTGIVFALLAAPAALAAPTLTVSPNTGLNRAGQSVTVSGSGWTPGDTVTIQQCRDAPGHGRCLVGFPTTTPNASGAFSTTVSVNYAMSGTNLSCEDPYCEMV